MIYSIFPIKDATLYEQLELQNTGLDSILEINNNLEDSGNKLKYNSRFLIKFDISDISKSISDGKITNPRFYLDLFVSDVQEIPIDYKIYAFPVSGTWDMGVGKSDDTPITTAGVSWKYRDGYKDNTGILWQTASFAVGTTGSFTTTPGGGNWYTGSGYEASQSFSYQNADVRMDVTDIVKKWISSSIQNEGFILKREDSTESSTATDGGIIKFFSRDTHTIYPPRLEVAWDNQVFNTGSLTQLTDEDIIIYSRNIKQFYPSGSKAKIRVIGRSKFPTKTFATSSQVLTIKYLPTSSYYSIKDARTDDIIIPFDDNYTKVSCDTTSNYFDLWTSGLQPERNYRILFKIVRDGGNTVDIYDDNIIFKISR